MATTPVHDRQPTDVARTSAYAAAALTEDVVTALRTAPSRVRTLPDELRSTVRELPTRSRERLRSRSAELGSTLDRKADEGRKVVAEVRSDERVAGVERELQPVGDQLKATRSKLKAAATSLRGTVGASLDAGRDQSRVAEQQVKAAVTSTRTALGTTISATRRIA